jgi:glutaminyl-peptide cyclotransferase
VTHLDHRGRRAYDRETFKGVRRFAYAGEGWGLTRTDHPPRLGDGSATLKLLDPSPLLGVDAQVRDEHGPVTALNELEMVKV